MRHPHSISSGLALLLWPGLIAAASILKAWISNMEPSRALNAERTLRLLTGNFLIDAAIQLIFTGLPMLVVGGLAAGMLRAMKKTGFWTALTASLALIQGLIFLVLALLQLPLAAFIGLDLEPYKAIRPSIGSAFLTALFCGLLVWRRGLPWWAKLLLATGLALPFLLLPLIPFSLESTGISWAHLGD